MFICFKLAKSQIIVAALLFAAAPQPVHAADLIEQQRVALRLIVETANDICYSVEQRGQSKEVEQKLNGVVFQVSSLDIPGTAQLHREDYRGVLQKDLASTLVQSANCKKSVLTLLVEKMLPQTSRGLSPAGRPPAAIKKTEFRLPADGVPMNNAQVGPFCCTGRIVVVRSPRDDPIGYIYFFSWRGQAYNVPGGSIVPDIAVQVSGPERLEELNSHQVVREIHFSAARIRPQSGWVTAGILAYRATLTNFDLKKGPSSLPYFNMGSLKVRIEVRIRS